MLTREKVIETFSYQTDPQFVVALTFAPSSATTQVENFRRILNFSSYSKYAPSIQLPLHIPLVSQFILKKKSLKMIERIEEIIDGHFWGLDNPLDIEFFELQLCKKNSRTLFLVPKMPEEIYFFLEELSDHLEKEAVFFKRNHKRSFVPRINLGSFNYEGDLAEALELFHDSNTMPLKLNAEGLYLFKNIAGIWTKNTKLLSFPATSLLQEKYLAL